MSKKPTVAELGQHIAELTEALQRERADVINVRRRHDEQMAAVRNMVKANVVRDLLPVIDNLERSLKHVPKDLAGHDYIKGVQGVVKQFEKTLSDLGVQRIKTVGEVFDPRYHEAISMEEGDGTIERVSEELQAGYQLGDEIIPTRHGARKDERVMAGKCGECLVEGPLPSDHARINFFVQVPETLLLLSARRERAGGKRLEFADGEEGQMAIETAVRIREVAANTAADDEGAYEAAADVLDEVYGLPGMGSMMIGDIATYSERLGGGDISKGLAAVACGFCQTGQILANTVANDI